MKSLYSFLLCLIIGTSSTSFSQTVTIGKQVWMAKNLDVSTFRNGDPIPEAKTNAEWEAAGKNKQPAWCYYDNYDIELGKLYNWYAVNDPRGLAPVGYHIPADKEWTQLSDYLGGYEVAGKKMKSTSGWFENGNGTNESGFNGLPGGYRNYTGTFNYIRYGSYWWSSTEPSAISAWHRGLVYDAGNVNRITHRKGSGLSVRCLKD